MLEFLGAHDLMQAVESSSLGEELALSIEIFSVEPKFDGADKGEIGPCTRVKKLVGDCKSENHNVPNQ